MEEIQKSAMKQWPWNIAEAVTGSGIDVSYGLLCGYMSLLGFRALRFDYTSGGSLKFQMSEHQESREVSNMWMKINPECADADCENPGNLMCWDNMVG